jgi:hypothetical protein
MAMRVGLSAVIILLVIHGLVHLLGPIVYWRLADVEGFAYKTTVLNGVLDLGLRGVQVFGALWLLPAIGFIVAAVALAIGWTAWLPVLVAATAISVALTVADWPIAFAGAIVDVAILLVLVAREAGWGRL